MKNAEYWLTEEKLKNPKHDEICFWIFNNYKKVLKNYPEFNFGHKKDIDEDEIKKDFEKFINPKKYLEFAIPNVYIHAFIDVALIFDCNYHFFNFMVKNNMIGIYHPVSVFFEVKPIIKELGSIIRQINHYKKYFEKPVKVILVSETELSEDKISILKENDILFYQYKNEQ